MDASLQGDKVLLADDEAPIRELMRVALAPLGCELLEAGTGSEVLDCVERHAPDLVLLDLRMPGGTGEDVLVAIRDRQDAPDVVIVTGYGTVEAATLAVRYHARDFLAKPFSPAVLQQKVTEALTERRERRHREALLVELRRGQEAATQALVRSRQFLTKVVDTCVDAIVVSESDGRIILVNDAACRLCGLTEEQLIGMPLDQFLAFGEDASRLWEEVQRSGHIEGFETYVTDMSAGQRRPVEVNVGLLEGESGEPLGAVGVYRDVSEKRELLRELEEANERLRALSLTDPVTGVHNHRMFQDRIREEVRQALRYSSPLSLIMADTDDLKQVNDTYGHQAGDQMLLGLAKVLHSHLRETDVLCRYGGDEFAVILTHTSLERAAEVAHRLREAVESCGGDLYHLPARVTISIGVASLGPGISTAEELIAAADTALLEAKRQGRNRIGVAPSG